MSNQEIIDSQVNHINSLVKAAKAAGIKTFVVNGYEGLYSPDCEFLDI